MPDITITNNTDLNLSASANDEASTLKRYLQNPLKFTTPPSFDSVASLQLKDVDESVFPVNLSAQATGNFAVKGTTLTVQPGICAKVDVLRDKKKPDFLKSLDLDDTFAPDALVSFEVDGSVSVGDQAPIGTYFSVGVTETRRLSLTSFRVTASTDKVAIAIQNAATGITIPHDVADLNSIPVRGACRIDASGCLKFCASVTYNFLNDPLASVSIPVLPAIAITATGGATVQATASHTGDHTITIARLSNDVFRISFNLTRTDDFATSIQLSTGLTADLGSTDALGLVLKAASPDSDQVMTEIKQELPDDAKKLSSDIESALKNAVCSSLQVSLQAVADHSKSNSRVFVCEVNMPQLDAAGKAALAAALTGDFTRITLPQAQLPSGITAKDDTLTVTSTISHSVGVHLLGIFNAQSMSKFIRTSTFGATKDSNDIVLASQKSDVVTTAKNLRKLVLKYATLTVPASANTPGTGPSLNLMFFDRQSPVSASKLQQFVNAMRYLNSPDASKAGQPSGAKAGIYALYLGMNLSSAQCKQLFSNSVDWHYYLTHQRLAQQTILKDDKDSELRLKLFNISDTGVWDKLAQAGTGQNIGFVLKDAGFSDEETPFLVTDVFTALWWSQEMAAYAAALRKGQSPAKVGGDLVKADNLGFDEPWLIIACWNILNQQPVVECHFTSSQPKAKAANAA